MYRILSILLMFAAGIASGCSNILEDRSVCPCYLRLDLSGCDPDAVRDLQIWFFDGRGGEIEKDTVPGAFYGDVYEKPVPRGIVRYHVWGNLTGGRYDFSDTGSAGMRFTLRNGEPADSLFYYGNTVPADGEEVFERVQLHKEFSTMEVLLKGAPEGDMRKYFRVEVYCRTSGYYVDRRPAGGSWSVRSSDNMEDSTSCCFRYRLIRQENPEELVLSLSDVRAGRPEPLYTFPIGRRLIENGYDMQEEDLRDIRVELDLAVSSIAVITDDWKVSYPMKIEF